MKVYLNDILIFAKSLEDHLTVLDEALTKLSEAGLKIRKVKCTFAKDSAEFLGYKITFEDISFSEDRIQALLNAPRPTNGSKIR